MKRRIIKHTRRHLPHIFIKAYMKIERLNSFIEWIIVQFSLFHVPTTGFFSLAIVMNLSPAKWTFSNVLRGINNTCSISLKWNCMHHTRFASLSYVWVKTQFNRLQHSFSLRKTSMKINNSLVDNLIKKRRKSLNYAMPNDLTVWLIEWSHSFINSSIDSHSAVSSQEEKM